MDTYKQFAVWLEGVLDMNETLTKEQLDKIREKVRGLNNIAKTPVMRC